MRFLCSKADLPPPQFDLHQQTGRLQLRNTWLIATDCCLREIYVSRSTCLNEKRAAEAALFHVMSGRESELAAQHPADNCADRRRGATGMAVADLVSDHRTDRGACNGADR